MLYLEIGFEHITKVVEAYDHMLFLVALSALYQLKDWRKLAVLVTAFTIGHSITLALASMQWLSVSSEHVEFFIALTVLLTAISNLLQEPAAKGGVFDKRQAINYGIALFFGLIHGLGFSSRLAPLLMPDEPLWQPLLMFNMGVEVGQIVVVTCILGLSALVLRLTKAVHRDWKIFASGAAVGVAIFFLLERFYIFFK